MAIVDPKSGVAYLTGARLPSAHVNTVWAQQARIIDAVDGCTMACNGAVTINNAGSGSWTWGTTIDVTWTGTTNYPKLGSRTLSRVEQPVFTAISALGGATIDFKYGTTGALRQNYVDPGATRTTALVPIRRFIDGATITAVKVRAKGATHGGAWPATNTQPQIELIYRDNDDGETIVGTQADTSGSAGAYEVIHDINITGLSHVVLGSDRRRYMIRFGGEAGAGAIAGLEFYGITIEYTVTSLTPGG